jgi:large subunit ribosomal protein L13
MKTYSQKPTEVSREWFVVDAANVPLGRLTTLVAQKLTGKQKPTYTPHIDGGDYVIVINAKLVKATGDKRRGKVYYRHSGYPGSIKATTLEQQLEKDSTKVIEKAVYGMLPKNKLRDGRMERLKVYSDSDHSHEAQKPKKLSLTKGKS